MEFIKSREQYIFIHNFILSGKYKIIKNDEYQDYCEVVNLDLINNNEI